MVRVARLEHHQNDDEIGAPTLALVFPDFQNLEDIVTRGRRDSACSPNLGLLDSLIPAHAYLVLDSALTH